MRLFRLLGLDSPATIRRRGSVRLQAVLLDERVNPSYTCTPTPPACPPPPAEYCTPPVPTCETPSPTCENPPSKPAKVKGNNGVGNGLDPQPPGNPPINDGPGTSPGNPGNRGGAKK